MVYASTFHYGAKSGEFGFGMYATRNGGFPIRGATSRRGGSLGVSEADRSHIGELIRSHMLED